MLPRNAELWLPGLIKDGWRRGRAAVARGGPIEIFFCIADHFEPAHKCPTMAAQRARVAAWSEHYPKLAARFRDSDGRPPRHTFFYSVHEYHRGHLDRLEEICRAGLGELEVHLHHDRDTSAGTRDKIQRFTDILGERGLLCRDRLDGRLKYGFIHGHWALDNSKRGGRCCGVDDEISILLDTGCYADFTMPSAPDDSQTSTVNRIYRAVDDPRRPKSHDRGVEVTVGGPPTEGLLCIQGPLALDWGSRKWGVLPRLENGSLHAGFAPTARRFRLWLDAGIGVAGRPEWVFIKVYAHGANAANAAMMLGDEALRFHEDLARHFNDGERYRLHYVTARELTNLVLAAEAGESGAPGELRDYRLESLLARQ